jgi:hypothetical protein
LLYGLAEGDFDISSQVLKAATACFVPDSRGRRRVTQEGRQASPSQVTGGPSPAVSGHRSAVTGALRIDVLFNVTTSSQPTVPSLISVAPERPCSATIPGEFSRRQGGRTSTCYAPVLRWGVADTWLFSAGGPPSAAASPGSGFRCSFRCSHR